MRTVVLSDCHIGSPEANVAQLNRFLLSLECDRLILAGDMFDLWDATDDDIRRTHPGTLDILRKLKAKGVKIEYLLGNHDETYLKTPVMSADDLPVVNKIEFSLDDGRKVSIIHGHEYDYVYQKHKLLYKLLAWANRTSAKIIGLSMKSLEKKKTCTDLSGTEYSDTVQKIHADARKAAAKAGANIIIMGHTHAPQKIAAAVGLAEFYNSGDWKVHNSYVSIDGDKIGVRYLGGDHKGSRFYS